MDGQSNKTHKSRAVGNKAAKKQDMKKQKKGIDTQPNRGSNFKAFAGASAQSRKGVRAAHAASKRENAMTLPSRDRSLRTLVQEPPLLVAVVGPPRCGKSTLIKSMVKFYTQRGLATVNGSITVVAGRARRVTFVECPNKLSAMCDLAKVCDLAIIMVDGAFGFEMETFEFLSVAQTHGFPKVMGVISKLDMLRTNKALKKTKRMLRHRFWHEVSAGASVMCLSPMVRGMYRPSDVLKMHRALVTIEPKMQQWRSTHSCVFVDRFEDVTAPAAVSADADCSRSIAFYGYVRGKPINGVGDKFHVPGLGDVTVAAISRQQDPCEAAESNATSTGSKLRTLGAKHKRCYAPYCNIGGVEFDEDGIFVAEDEELASGAVERHGAGLELMRQLRDEEDDSKTTDAIKRSGMAGLRVLGGQQQHRRQNHDDDDDADDFFDDQEGGGGGGGDARRKVRFANEDTLELAVPDIDSGSDASSSSSDDDDDDNNTSRRRRAAVAADGASKKKQNRPSARAGLNDDDDDDSDDPDDDLYGFGEAGGDDDGDLVASFQNDAAANNSRSLLPLRPGDRDTSRIGTVSGIEWLEGASRLELKRLFVTGQSLTGAADGDDDEEVYGGGGNDEDVASDGGYESVDSEEMNDASLFTTSAAAAAAGGGGSVSGGATTGSFGDDDDLDFYDDDNFDEEDGGKKQTDDNELGDDLQQYVDFFAARNADGGDGVAAAAASSGRRVKPGLGGGTKSSNKETLLSLDETEALAGPKIRGGGRKGVSADDDDDIRMAGGGSSLLDDEVVFGGGANDNDDDDDGYGGAQQQQGGGKKGGGQQQRGVDEEYMKKKMEKKRLFDESYDATTGKNNTTGFYNHLLEEERERRQNIETALEDVGQDIDKRVEVVGFFSGLYVRFVVHDVPVEFVRNFDPRQPIIAGGVNPGEDRLEVVHARFLRHRWYPRILKAQDPITVSIGWRRIQVQPLYSTEDGNGRWRYLKYTPKHMHCLAAFYGPVVPPNTGFIVIPTVEQKSPHFRALASGYTVGVDAATHIVKKLKITGVPESIHKTTCFVKGMFNSDVEAAKFLGAKVKTVSGLRGTIKKVMKGKAGIVRCTFEDKLLKSDICFVRTWKPVDVPRYCEVVPNLLMGSGGGGGAQQQQQWRGMRTMAQLRREEGIPLEHRPDSEYMDFDPRRQPRNIEDEFFASSSSSANATGDKPSNLVSRSTRMKLPFNLREEFVPLKQRSQLQDQVRAETVIAPEPKEMERHALLNMFRDKADAMQEKRVATRNVKKKQREKVAAVEEERSREKLKKAKKETARKLEFRAQHKTRASSSSSKPRKSK